MAALAVVACCGLTSLIAAGVAAAVLWSVGLGLAAASLAVVAIVWFVGRARSRAHARRRRS